MTPENSGDEYEIENIVSVRRVATGREYKIKWKGFEGEDAYSWEPECNLANAQQMLANFRLRCSTAGFTSPSQPPDQKRRPTSASSSELTPEYRELRVPQQQTTPSRRPKPVRALLERKLQVRHRRQKLHSSSKEIAATSLQQRQCQRRVDGSSGRVSTRKAENQHEQLLLNCGHEAPSLHFVLTHPPPAEPTDSAADAALNCFFFPDTPHVPDPAASGEECAPQDLWTLRHLVTARGQDGNCGDPYSLAATLARAAALGAACPLDAPLPDETDAVRTRGRRLIHLAATVGPNSPRLLLLLLSAGANPDVTDAFGRTALMLAARAGDARACERLLQFDAQLDLLDSAGASALALAAAAGRWEAAGALLRRGAEFAGLGVAPAQLEPWSELLSRPLLRALRQLPENLISKNLVYVHPAYLSALVPGGRRAFTFVTRPCSSRSVHLLVTAAAELDGLGGVRLRGVDGPVLSQLSHNGFALEPLACGHGLSVYGLQLGLAGPGEDNRIRLAFSDACPARCRLKLLAQVVCVATVPD